MTRKSRKVVVLRGALGGVLGYLVKAAFAWVYYSYIKPPTTWGYLVRNPVLWFAIYGTPIAACLGVMIAEIIELLILTRVKHISLVARGAIGSLLIAVPGIILSVSDLASAMPNLLSLLIVATFYGDFGIGIGLLARIAAGSKKRGVNDVSGE